MEEWEEPRENGEIEHLNLTFLENTDLDSFLFRTQAIYEDGLKAGDKVKINAEVIITATQFTYYFWKDDEGKLNEHRILELPANSGLKIDDSFRPF